MGNVIGVAISHLLPSHRRCSSATSMRRSPSDLPLRVTWLCAFAAPVTDLDVNLSIIPSCSNAGLRLFRSSQKVLLVSDVINGISDKSGVCSQNIVSVLFIVNNRAHGGKWIMKTRKVEVLCLFTYLFRSWRKYGLFSRPSGTFCYNGRY